MALKNRTKITTTLDNKLIVKLDKLSKDTRIAKSKLFDEAVELLLKKHNN
jgi:metal-responsive CopG/Arc/MetJ family transcriptional regulator